MNSRNGKGPRENPAALRTINFALMPTDSDLPESARVFRVSSRSQRRVVSNRPLETQDKHAFLRARACRQGRETLHAFPDLRLRQSLKATLQQLFGSCRASRGAGIARTP